MRAVTPSSSGSAFRSSSSSFSSAAGCSYTLFDSGIQRLHCLCVRGLHCTRSKKRKKKRKNNNTYCCRAPAQTRSVFHAGQAQKQPQDFKYRHASSQSPDRTTAKLNQPAPEGGWFSLWAVANSQDNNDRTRYLLEFILSHNFARNLFKST